MDQVIFREKDVSIRIIPVIALSVLTVLGVATLAFVQTFPVSSPTSDNTGIVVISAILYAVLWLYFFAYAVGEVYFKQTNRVMYSQGFLYFLRNPLFHKQMTLSIDLRQTEKVSDGMISQIISNRVPLMGGSIAVGPQMPFELDQTTLIFHQKDGTDITVQMGPWNKYIINKALSYVQHLYPTIQYNTVLVDPTKLASYESIDEKPPSGMSWQVYFVRIFGVELLVSLIAYIAALLFIRIL